MSVALAMTEAQLMDATIELAQWRKWRTFHVRPGRKLNGSYVTAVQGDGVGWPDLLLLRGKRVIVAELKSERGRLTRAQQEWLDAWRETGFIETHVWRPGDWTSGVINGVLA